MADTLLSPTISTTQTALVRNVLRMLGEWTIEDTHSSTPGANYTSLTVATDATTRWEVGDYLDWIEDNTYDAAQVTAVTATTLTVRGGALGTTQQAHAANAVVRKITGGRFLGYNANKAVTDALKLDLWPELFAVWQTTYTPNTGTQGLWYSIAAAAEETLSIYQQNPAVTTNDPMYFQGFWNPYYVDSSISSTNKAIQIPSWLHPTQLIYAQYLAIPTVAELSAGMAQVVEYGACRRLLEWDAAAKTPSLRPPSGSLAPGQGMRDAAYFLSQQRFALKQEQATLVRRFPRRRFNWQKNAARKHYTDRVR